MSILTHITGWRSRIINAMIDTLQRQRIIAGDGLVCAETPNGTHLSLARTPATKPPYPFGADEWLWGVDILSNDTIRVGDGLVSLQSWQGGMFRLFLVLDHSTGLLPYVFADNNEICY